MKKSITIISLSLGLICGAFATDVTQWRGNDRSGVYPETKLLKSWPEGGPTLLWENSEGGLGYSGPAIVGDKIYIVGTSDDKKTEFLTVLNLKGEKLWTLDYGNAWDKSFQNARPIPSVVGNMLYTISGDGEVVCINLSKKEIAWKVEAKKEFGGDHLPWGYGENVLVHKGKVFFTVGGKQTSMLAFDAKTGKLLWKTESLGKRASYLSPVIAKHKGKEMVISGLDSIAFGVDIDNGKILWSNVLNTVEIKDEKQRKTFEINAATPIYKDGKVFISAGYDCGAYMLELPKGGENKAKEVWKSADFDNHHGGIVLLNGRLYGSNWINNDKGQWMCLDWETGKTIYKTQWEKHQKGTIAAADGMLYIYEESRGDIALVKPANEFEVVSHFKVPHGSGQNWCHIVICDGVMYVRHGKSLMAFDIKEQK